MPELISIECTIRRSAFSGERIVEFKSSQGRAYKTVVPVHYVRLSDDKPLSEDVPARAASAQGFVRLTKIVRDDGSSALALPDGEIVPD
jgi:hypothetical protein